MSEIMLALGDYRFSTSTAAWERLSRSDTFRWATSERLQRRPAKQFIGPGSTKIEIAGRIYPHYRGGLGQVAAMREQAAKGEPLMLVDGIGNVWGQFVILSVSEDNARPTGFGAPRRVEFRLDLESYGEDEEAGQ
jgi:phage protein U